MLNVGTSYPWIVNLVVAETSVGCEIRYRKNMQSVEKIVDPSNIVTRIYPLGYGEGDNQLTIESVNNKIPYLEADTVTTYGLKEAIWVDGRFEDATSLKATAASMLNDLKTPYVSYNVSSLDLFKKTGQSFDEFKEGKIVRVIDSEDDIDFDAKIIAVEKSDVSKATVNVTIANKSKDVAGSIANLQERARINETYAQGSANLMTIPFADNADTSNPAIFEFYLPSSMVNINKALLRLQIQPFRGYSKAIKGGGAIATSTQSGGGSSQTSSSGGGSSQTSSSGGGSSQTSSSGGGTSQSTNSGGGDTATSTSGGGMTKSSEAVTLQAQNIMVADSGGYGAANHNHGLVQGRLYATCDTSLKVTGYSAFTPSGAHEHNAHSHNVTFDSHSHNVQIKSHIHDLTINAHTHSIDIPTHTHSIDIPTHTHSVAIPAHSHNITIPEHTHEIQFGIYLGTSASTITVKVDGKTMPITDMNNIDVIKYLSTDNAGKITRDLWHKIEIIPDKLTRISAYLFLDIFTNSRGGGDY